MSRMKYFVRTALVYMFALSSGFISPSQANVGEAFGFGARIQSLAGAALVVGPSSFAAYHNPAALAQAPDGGSGQAPDGDPKKRLRFDFGLLYMQPSFTSIPNVITQNKFNADADVMGDVDTSYRNTLGQQLGFSYQFMPETYRLTIGLVSFLPIEQLAFMDTGEAYVPEYFLYRSRTQRPQFDFGVGIAPWSSLSFGLGFHVAYSLTSNGSLFINTGNNRISSMRFGTSLKPKVAPYFGVFYSPVRSTARGEPFSEVESSTAKEPYKLGAVVRLPVASDNTIILNSAARVLGDFAAIDFNFNALSTLFYDPLAIELGGSWRYSPRGIIYLQVEYQMWGSFEAPALVIQQPTTTSCTTAEGTPCTQTVQISPGALPPYPYRNILVPRYGQEIKLDETTVLRFGYAYRPSILAEVSNGSGNYLDPSKHQFNLGLGIEFSHLAGLEIPFHLDFNLSYQRLISQTIVKTPGNEEGDLTDQKIGAPGYTAGGHLLGGGASVSVAF